MDSTDMARISSEFEKREERRSMTTQTITNNCNKNNNNKDNPNQGLFPVESSDEKHISAGAAGGRQELRFTVHSVYCVQKFTVHKLLFTVHNHRKLLFIVNKLLFMAMFATLMLILALEAKAQYVQTNATAYYCILTLYNMSLYVTSSLYSCSARYIYI